MGSPPCTGCPKLIEHTLKVCLISSFSSLRKPLLLSLWHRLGELKAPHSSWALGLGFCAYPVIPTMSHFSLCLSKGRGGLRTQSFAGCKEMTEAPGSPTAFLGTTFSLSFRTDHLKFILGYGNLWSTWRTNFKTQIS